PGNAPGEGLGRSGTDASGAGDRPEAGAVRPGSGRVFGAEPAAGTVRLPDTDVSGPEAGTTRPGTGAGSPVPGADSSGAGGQREAGAVRPGSGRVFGAEPAAGTVRLPDTDVSGPEAGTTRPG